MDEREIVGLLIWAVVVIFLTRALVVGEVYFRGSRFRRSENPFWYWLTMSFGFIAVVSVPVLIVLLR